ncbi:hypothetical protein Dtox_1407 [Desulfofarcimen acetoxidans DSM 771]|uniref:Uncharacterized protein n=1 Tax=Desulfofarcimen acetoxidans (strain ATCC 49208 / DSM 771 / KCTC 5769 / VKM B-1644 / 5575) TaxID=485916 RepID=C8W6J3_DESAS|nr:MarR family transcriptional regulator [Desulfofarcimen acetoxidans]ACV62282.1 hypothetical protein Dtox_1407 [Desulfofarcimen acetoxidans DSM 771]
MSFQEPSQEIPIKDSCYAFGVSMMAPKLSHEIKSTTLTVRAFEVVNYLNEAEGLTVTALATLIKHNRAAAGRVLKTLYSSCMVKWLTVCGNNTVFKLWMLADRKPPKTSNEACRMAVYGFYYALARKEVPGFSWRLIRKPKTPLLAEMTYLARDTGKEAKMIIDAPRRGEKPWPEAGIIIFPSIEEANSLVLSGKRYTSDFHLLEKNGKLLANRLFEKA